MIEEFSKIMRQVILTQCVKYIHFFLLLFKYKNSNLYISIPNNNKRNEAYFFIY